MLTVAFTGPRKLTNQQTDQAIMVVYSLPRCRWLIGCADGVDAIVREFAPRAFVLFKAQESQPYHYQERSKRMIDALAAAGGTLHAFPNKLCPKELTLNSWAGSGTWGTILYAHSLGCLVELHPLTEIDIPDWLQQKQLNLF